MFTGSKPLPVTSVVVQNIWFASRNHTKISKTSTVCGMACLKADMYYHGVNSLVCVTPWVSLPKGPYFLHLTRNDRSDFANAQADLSLH